MIVVKPTEQGVTAELASAIDPSGYLIKPQPEGSRLVETVKGLDWEGNAVDVPIVVERPLTVFLNGQEIVTLMTVGDHPELLAVGYLVNQNMLRPDDTVTAVDMDEETETVVVRTARTTDYEAKLRKKTLTSGCAQGTIFGDIMETFDAAVLPDAATVRVSWIRALLKAINTTPSLYMAAGAIHGCVLCHRDRPLVYMEDVGRHNALDKIAGFMHLAGVSGADKIMYTTGRMTSEMVIKTVQMGIPILLSRSGSTAWGVELAKKAGLTLVSRAKGKRFVVLAGAERVEFDLPAGAD